MAMRKEPERRYGSAEQLAGDIRRYLAGQAGHRPQGHALVPEHEVRHAPLAAGRRRPRGVLPDPGLRGHDLRAIGAHRGRARPRRRAARGRRARAGAGRGGFDVSRRSVQALRSGGEPRQPGHRAGAAGLEHQAACATPSRTSRRPRPLCSRRWARCTTAWDSIRTRCRSCASHWRCSRNRRTSRVSIRCWNWAACSSRAESAATPRCRCRRHCACRSANSARSTWSPAGRCGCSGQLRHQQGNAGGAIDLYKRALDILETAQAPPTEIARLLDDLAQDYEREQQWMLAKQTYERALAIDRDILGNDHPRVASHLHNLAIVAQNMGDLTARRKPVSRGDRQRGARVRRPASGNRGGAGKLCAAARARRSPGRGGAAAAQCARCGAQGVGRRQFQRRLRARESCHGAARRGAIARGGESNSARRSRSTTSRCRAIIPIGAAALMHLARLLVDAGKPQEALPLSEQSVAIWSATFPATHPPTAQAHAIHAYALAHLGRRREAADELAAAVPILLAARGPDDPAVRRAQAWWASARAPASPSNAGVSGIPRAPAPAEVAEHQLTDPGKSCRPDSRSLRCRRTAAR